VCSACGAYAEGGSQTPRQDCRDGAGCRARPLTRRVLCRQLRRLRICVRGDVVWFRSCLGRGATRSAGHLPCGAPLSGRSIGAAFRYEARGAASLAVRLLWIRWGAGSEVRGADGGGTIPLAAPSYSGTWVRFFFSCCFRCRRRTDAWGGGAGGRGWGPAERGGGGGRPVGGGGRAGPCACRWQCASLR